MKKLTLILAVLMMIPVSAFGLEMLNDTAMDDVTAQSGVSIAFDDIQLFVNMGKLAYIDCDGLVANDWSNHNGTCGGPSGAITMSNFQIDVLNVNAITGTTGTAAGGNDGINNGIQGSGTGLALKSTSCGDIHLFYAYATSGMPQCMLDSTTPGAMTYGLDNYTATSANAFEGRPMTIDVTSALPVLSEMYQYNNGTTDTVGGVIIGLPTIEIYISDMIFTPTFDDDTTAYTLDNTVNDDDTYGTIQILDLTATLLSGWVEIAPH